MFYVDEGFTGGVSTDEKIKIKFEIDVCPPTHAMFERRYQLRPSPYNIDLYDLPSLFAGKIHAVICRAWKTGSREETCMTMFSCLQRVRLSIWSICAHVSYSLSASHPMPPVIFRRSNGCCASGLALLILHRRGRMSNRSFVTDRVSIYGVQIFQADHGEPEGAVGKTFSRYWILYKMKDVGIYEQIIV